MQTDAEKLRQDIRKDARKAWWQAVAATGTAFASGAALVGLLGRWLGKW